MTEIYIGKTNLFFLLILFNVFVILPLQIFLCLKAKNLIVKNSITIISTAMAIIFLILTKFATGYDGLFYIVFAMYAGIILITSIVIQIIFYLLKKKNG